MSEQSNNQGRAYEYICLTTLYNEISKFRCVEIKQNSAYAAAFHAWSQVGQVFQGVLLDSAKAAVATIFDMEPMIIEKSDDVLQLKIQPDNEGKYGDVRDIVISRKDVRWEIGLSLKHNHFAVKHSRLAKSLDFGQKWFGMPCSDTYWNDIKPIFDYLAEQKANRKNWSDLSHKDNDVYTPLLQAFMNEICVKYLTDYFSVIKQIYCNDWHNTNSKLLSVITFNSFILSLKKDLQLHGENNREYYLEHYSKSMFDFSAENFKYTSSQYNKFSDEIIEKCFSN